MSSLSEPLFPICAGAERVLPPHRDSGRDLGGSAPSNLCGPCGQGWAEATARPPLFPTPLPPAVPPGLRGSPSTGGLGQASIQPSCRGPGARFRGLGSGPQAPALRPVWGTLGTRSARGQAIRVFPGPGRTGLAQGCAGWRCGVVGGHRDPAGLCAPVLCSGLGLACGQRRLSWAPAPPGGPCWARRRGRVRAGRGGGEAWPGTAASRRPVPQSPHRSWFSGGRSWWGG